MSLSENDKRVLRLIKVGAENSITGAEISLTTKLTERTVRDIIKRLVVKHNIPIVGVRYGVFRYDGHVVHLRCKSSVGTRYR